MEAGETESVSLDEFDRDFPKIPTSGIVWKKLIMMTVRALFLRVQELSWSWTLGVRVPERVGPASGTEGALRRVSAVDQ